MLRRFAIACALVIVGSTSRPEAAAAQDLMAQCAAIVDPARRLECFEAVSRQARPSEANLHEISRQANAIVTALGRGMTDQQLASAVAPLADQIAAARRQLPNDNDRVILAHYDYAVQCWQDGQQLWSASVKYNAQHPQPLPVPIALVQGMVDRYQLPTVAADMTGMGRGVDATAAVPLLWLRAAQAVADGDGLLHAFGR